MSEDRSDRCIRGETHIHRINNWAGSDSYVEGSRRDPEDFDPMPDQPKLPYRLLMKAYHEDRPRKPGDIVYLWPHQLGSHHEMIEGIEYPDEARPPTEEKERPVPLMADHDDELVKKMADAIKKNDMQLGNAAARIAALEAELRAAKEPAKPTESDKKEPAKPTEPEKK